MSAGQAEERAQWARSAQELVGKVVGGKYRVERILGRGGMGTIYVAVQQPLGRRVALKVLHPTLGDGEADPEFQKRFLLEAATLSQLAHPNIVVVHDYGSLEDEHASCFMVMELLEGRTINQVLSDEGRFPPARALRIARDIARALRAAHDINVIHRDLKPANVMLCPGPEGESVKVLDFGLVKLLRDNSEELTAEGRFLGSPRYMSPEQIQRLPMDGRTDLYSLGVILYRMLSGEVPFAGDHAVQTLMAHLSKPVPPIATHGVEVPIAVEQIVLKLLEKDPDRRFLDATSLVRAIDAVWPQLSPEPLITSGEHARLSSEMHAIDLTPTSRSLPVITGQVPTITSAAALPSAEPARTRPRWVLPLVVVVGLSIGLGGAMLAASFVDTDQPEPEPRADTTVRAPEPEPDVPDVDPTPPPTEDPAPPPEASTFTLTVLSDPPGATLIRDGSELGQTPITIELDSERLRAAPARFTLHLRGHADVTFEQGPSESNLSIERHLPRLNRHRPTTSSSQDEEPRGHGADLSIKTQR